MLPEPFGDFGGPGFVAETASAYKGPNYCGENDMLLSKMTSTTFRFGIFKRPDGESFEISARLYECPPEYDYWLTIYDAVHKDWKQMHFTLFMPKNMAPSTDAAKTIVGGDALEQVKSNLLQAGPGGRPTTVSLQMDGL